MTPTALTVAALRAEGWLAEVVEHHARHSVTTNDLFGFVDVLALRDGETLAVQCTSRDHISHRVRKITDSPNLAAVRKAGWRLEVHGWDLHEGADRLKIVELS